MRNDWPGRHRAARPGTPAAQPRRWGVRATGGVVPAVALLLVLLVGGCAGDERAADGPPPAPRGARVAAESGAPKPNPVPPSRLAALASVARCGSLPATPTGGTSV